MLGLGHGMTWECVCSGDYSSMPIHAIVNHCDLRPGIGWCFFAVVLSFSGGCLDKWRVMISIEFVARLIGEALIGSLEYGDLEATFFALSVLVGGWYGHQYRAHSAGKVVI